MVRALWVICAGLLRKLTVPSGPLPISSGSSPLSLPSYLSQIVLTLWALVVLMVAVLMSNGWELDSRLFYIGNLLSVVPWGIFSVRVSRWTWRKLTDWFQRGHCHLLPKRHWSEQCAGVEYRNFRTEGILCLSPKTLSIWKHLRCGKVYRNLRHRTRCILDLAMIAKNGDKKLTELMMTYQVIGKRVRII